MSSDIRGDAPLETPGGTEAADRVADVLLLFGRSDDPLGVSRIARSLSLSKAVVHRILQSLASRSLVQAVPGGSAYVLGPAAAGLAARAWSQVDLRSVASPVLRRLRDKTRETTTLSVLVGNQRIYLDQFESQAATIVVAMAVGAAWAGIVALLKLLRGVSEVISTIMLNFVATSLIAYLMRTSIFGHRFGTDTTTKPIPSSGQVGGIQIIHGTGAGKVYGLIILSVVVGVLFHVLVNYTRFGFDLRAAGGSATAAQASGVSVRKMTALTLLMSGAVAGLVGMPILLGDSHSFSAATFQSGLGFTGIAIALLGRNNPIGIAFAALLWSFLDNSQNILDLNGIPKEVIQITQGVVVLSVVVAYELVRRFALVRQQRLVGRAVAPSAPPAVEGAPA